MYQNLSLPITDLKYQDIDTIIEYAARDWIVGELIADGWIPIATILVGIESYDDSSFQLRSVLGKPKELLFTDRSMHLCQAVIKSGRRSRKCLPDTTCSVSGCERQADYEVIFYDFYSEMTRVNFKTDYTCPFICEEHMQLNEAQTKGIRQPRSSIYYPYSKGHGGQGYTKYLPAAHTLLLC